MSAAGPAPRVRRARPDDWPFVRGLLREIDGLHAALAPGYFRARDRADADWRRLLDDAAGAALVAEIVPEPGTTIGFIAVRVFDTPADPAMVARRRGHVDTLVVAAAYRRRGVGRRLMDAAGAWARGQGARELVLTTWAGNADADAFYERLGYRPLTRVLHAEI